MLTRQTNINQLPSDHNPILLEFSSSPITSSPPSQGKQVNWKKFSTLLSNDTTNTHPRTASIQDIDHAITAFTETIKSTVVECTYQSKTGTKRNTLPSEILNEIKVKNKLRREWQRNRDPAIKYRLNSKTKFIRSILKTHKQDEWDRFLTSLDTSDGSLFKINKSLINKKPAIHPLQGPNGLIYDAKAKAELIAESLEKQFKPNPGPNILEVEELAHNIRTSPIASSDLYTTPGSVQLIIKHLPKRKAPGEDLITNTALKLLPKNKLLTLTNILNGCLRLNYFPSTWKKAVIISIHKPGKDHSLPENYRPIALLSSISKVYERVILENIQKTTAKTIRKEQFAFRPGHSTVQQLTNLMDEITVNWNSKINTASVFIDVEKAFDKVWHDGLLFKMNKMHIHPALIKIIHSFLENRTFAVKQEDQTSTSRPILSGVPQGSCLSPTLFLIYTNDIPLIPKANLALFADDTMFSAQNHNARWAAFILQKQVDLAAEWFKRWRLKINEQKTVALLFGNKNTKNIPPIKINDHPIKWSDNVKYLGVTLNRRLGVTQHINTIIKRATIVRGILYPLINKKSPIPLKTKILILKMYVIPILTYAGAAWAPLVPTHQWKRIEAVQTTGLRTITGNPTFVRNDILRSSAGLKTIRETITSQASAMFHKNSYSKYPHIRNLGHKPGETRRKTPKNRPLKWATAK
ncbi:uncharacterized protein LOC100161354 isoform X2 [Acyrthosiphon pisum]|uniref:Reverse transcriptase domain-containing protein n=1 Tax=Acyrthosiphon pisum TaxID=7029 RepID=A0A8R2HAU3_ACYPI|nr:uncharacterized protein LOC100161354 isoform X2 [Acyrthosiphon pisum]